MNTIYENTVKGVGDLAAAFAEEKTIILFGDSAPDTLKDYCYSIDVKKADAVIEPGQTLEIDGKQYKIQVVGGVMQSAGLQTDFPERWWWKRLKCRC